jgi:hypothetical protein
MIPFRDVPDGIVLLFAAAVGVCFGALGLALVKRLRGEPAPADVLGACLASYSLLGLLLFVGRSHPYNIFHVSVPLSLLVVISAAQCHEGWAVRPQRGQPASRAGVFVWNSIPRCALGVVVIWLLANPCFRHYPGALRSLFSALPPLGLNLLGDSEDIGGLPLERWDDVRVFEAVVSRLRALNAAGQTVAVLDDADTIFYQASGAPPWGRYSPTFPAIMWRSELATLVGAITDRGPQWVVIRANGLHASMLHREDDVWRVAHETVQRHYHLDGAIGVFEFWRRNEH